jgi:preprotein translocase subunit SecD
MDKKVISCPVIQSPITGGSGVINGQFTLQSAQALQIQLQYGALPIPLKVVDSTEVGPTLGAEAVQQSIVAGLIGLGIVLAFMLLYYRLPGLLADLALLIYAAVTFALFRMIPVTLTLAGIAGFILSIGMAVDANILIFERMKEELRAGRSLHAAVDAGFSRAWTSIRDSNFSTLITCAILYWFGSTFGASIIQGFAVTLAIGVIVSLFTAVLVSRTFLQLIVETGWVRDLRWYGLDQAGRVVTPAREVVA